MDGCVGLKNDLGRTNRDCVKASGCKISRCIPVATQAPINLQQVNTGPAAGLGEAVFFPSHTVASEAPEAWPLTGKT